MSMQKTLRKKISFTGVGLHSGKPSTCTLIPAGTHHGIWFKRTDVSSGNPKIAALHSCVKETTLCTSIQNKIGVKVRTIEHLMAALAALGIDNLDIEIDGEEMPILDGSSLPFYEAIKNEIVELGVPQSYFRILKPIKVEHKGNWASLKPALQFSIKYTFRNRSNPALTESIDLAQLSVSFGRELAGARTFGFVEDIEALRGAGLAQGGSLDNALIFEGEKVLNPQGLRFPNECARHKALDALGDLYLAGAPLLGRFEGYGSGHELNNRLLHALFEKESNWALITAPLPPRLSCNKAAG